MPVLTDIQFVFSFGPFEENELNSQSISPLSWLPNSDMPRQPTQTEIADYNAMIHRAPMLHIGAIPAYGEPGIQSVRLERCQRIKFNIVRYTDGRVFYFALGLKFFSRTQATAFIQTYNLLAKHPKIVALLHGNRNKIAKRRKAHKMCVVDALEQYYNGKATYGTTVRALRRRGLINKLEV